MIDYIFSLFTGSISSHSPEEYAPIGDCQSELFKLMAKKIVFAGNGNNEEAVCCNGKSRGWALGQIRVDLKPSSPIYRLQEL